MDKPRDEASSTEGAVAGAQFEPLRDIGEFGSNPGNLRMRLLVPAMDDKRRPPLVVALHGCTQTAEGFADGSGWRRVADEHQFLLLLPEQRRANNQQTCFTWFEPGDTRRGGGEVESIRQMIAWSIEKHGADPRRVFVTGLSAGGAMAGALLATYPELFAGGAIVAGLPYGAATSASEAFDCMFVGRTREPRLWGDAVRAAAPAPDLWPSVAIWHGTSDAVVKPINAGELAKQWTNVHGVGSEAPDEDRIGAIARRVWRDAGKRACVTAYTLPGFGHGMPIADNEPPAPFFLPAGLSAARQIASDFGLLEPAPPKSFLRSLGLGS